MSVQLEVINVIIPRKYIDRVYSGGSNQLIVDDNIPEEFYDDNIIRYGAMNQLDIGLIIDKWKNLGLKGTRKEQGKLVWFDMCVVDTFSGPTLPCRWISIIDQIAVYKK